MITMEVNLNALKRALIVVPKQLKEELADACDHIGLSFMKNFRQHRLQGPPGVYGDGRKGLYGTFNYSMLFGKEILDMGVQIRSGSNIAERLEEGGTVTARGEDLKVPIKGNAASRQELYTAGHKLKKMYKRKGKVRGTFILFSKKTGKEFIAKRIGGKVVLLFVRKGSVSNDPMLGFYDLWEEQQSRRFEIINKAIDKAIKI